MNAPYILLVIALATVKPRGSAAVDTEWLTVTMQQFGNKEACVFAMSRLKANAGKHIDKLIMQCVPQGNDK